ncbi:MAG: hypothetical protein HZY76_08985 [Anaerolineae bacterium]|nr:MAG: hypothetical protein HZY76_08985 [Anaerolineae bacterium]
MPTICTADMNDLATALTSRLLIITFLFVVVAPFLPLLISQQWGWWQAWAYAVVTIAAFVVSRALAGRRNPELLVESHLPGQLQGGVTCGML